MKKRCNKCNNKNQCTCQNNCNNMEDIYLFLGRYVYKLLENLDLPCGHPSLKQSLEMLMMGKHLPCGHPSLEELIALAIRDNEKCKCHECECECHKKPCYSKHHGCNCK